MVAAIAVAGASGCGGGEKTYAMEPTYACLRQLGKVNFLPVIVKNGNDTRLGEGTGGYQFMVFFGDPDAGWSNVLYVDILRNPAEAKKVVSDYREHAAAGEMGYSADAQVSRKGNVAFSWDHPGIDPAFEHAFARCLG